MMKRAFDVVAALVGLLVLTPLFTVVAFLIKLDSQGPVFFRQERIGRGFRPLFIYKFRTMVKDAPRRGGPITFGRDPRITRVGRFLRMTKIDEFPQLINVLKGEMSLVGPRPEVRKYVDMFRQDYEIILTVRPGITDLASVKYRDEAALLGRSENPEEEYAKRILPEKIELAKEYLSRSSIFFDLTLILKTLFQILPAKFPLTQTLSPMGRGKNERRERKTGFPSPMTTFGDKLCRGNDERLPPGQALPLHRKLNKDPLEGKRV